MFDAGSCEDQAGAIIPHETVDIPFTGGDSAGQPMTAQDPEIASFADGSGRVALIAWLRIRLCSGPYCQQRL